MGLVNWIHVGQGRDQLLSLVSTVTVIRISIKGWEFLEHPSDCWLPKD
jgi:hypothetical protein